MFMHMSGIAAVQERDTLPRCNATPFEPVRLPERMKDKNNFTHMIPTILNLLSRALRKPSQATKGDRDS